MKIIIEHLVSCDACGEPLGDDYPEWFLCKKCRKKNGIGEFRTEKVADSHVISAQHHTKEEPRPQVATCSNRFSDGAHCGLCDHYGVYS